LPFILAVLLFLGTAAAAVFTFTEDLEIFDEIELPDNIDGKMVAV